jgi:hypothetical protein
VTLTKVSRIQVCRVQVSAARSPGLIDAQQANDPGGDRWSRLLDRAIDMFADNVGIPATIRRTT